jgi:hypothetical protein
MPEEGTVWQVFCGAPQTPAVRLLGLSRAHEMKVEGQVAATGVTQRAACSMRSARLPADPAHPSPPRACLPTFDHLMPAPWQVDNTNMALGKERLALQKSRRKVESLSREVTTLQEQLAKSSTESECSRGLAWFLFAKPGGLCVKRPTSAILTNEQYWGSTGSAVAGTGRAVWIRIGSLPGSARYARAQQARAAKKSGVMLPRLAVLVAMQSAMLRNK